MKVLWLTNIEIPLVSQHCGDAEQIYGGWLDETVRNMLKEDNISLFLLYPSKIKRDGEIGKLKYRGFVEPYDEQFFLNMINDFKPDIVHIWGTEFKHCLYLVQAAKKAGCIDNLIISIQGLVSIYSQHFCMGLPHDIIHHRTFHEWVRGKNILQSQKDFEKRGKDEIESLKLCKNVIGRTDFDYAVTHYINNDVTYYCCNETLRAIFYKQKWDISKVKRHSIFISQCSYPVKGFHFAIKALSLLKKQYPDVHIFTTGPNILDRNRDLLRRGTYTKYISSLIQKYDLEENVSFLGYLNAESMLKQYLTCNVSLSPSTIENSSNSVGEAMLVGCPVVSSDVGGIKSLLAHEEEGLLYQADAEYMLAYSISRIFEDDKYAIALGDGARKRALKTHDPESNYKRLLTIYDDIRGN